MAPIYLSAGGNCRGCPAGVNRPTQIWSYRGEEFWLDERHIYGRTRSSGMVTNFQGTALTAYQAPSCVLVKRVTGLRIRVCGITTGCTKLSLSICEDLQVAGLEELAIRSLCNRPCRNACALLPFCDRVVRISRDNYLPSNNRGIPVPKDPATIGGHLRRRRLLMKICQPEAARRLGDCLVSLSRWECDNVFPTKPYHARIAQYFGFNPFAARAK